MAFFRFRWFLISFCIAPPLHNRESIQLTVAGGELTSASLGNGVAETFNYDVRWRLLSASAVKGSNTIYSLSGPGNTMTYAPNSSLTAANDSVNGNWSYGYDALNRVASANTLTFDIDRNGNRWHQNPVGQGAQASFDTTTNHITNLGVAYDAAGNIINDGIGNAYTYDAEYRITQVQNSGVTTATYFYDAFGRRARRTVSGVGYDDVYDGPNMVAENSSSSGAWVRGEVYGPGHLATYNNGTTYFSHTDWLGSERVRSDVNGNSAGSCTSSAYGDGYSCTGTDPSPIKYAGMEYDTETGLYHTQFRYYNPRLGLWMTSDPAGLGVADPGNPQSLNRYSYVVNSPMSWIDPFGLGLEKIFEETPPPAPQVCWWGGVKVDWSLCQLAIDAAAAQVSAIINAGPVPSPPAPPPSRTYFLPPRSHQQCVQDAIDNANAEASDEILANMTLPFRGMVLGTFGGAVIGCVLTSEVGCVEGAIPGAITGFFGGTLEGVIDGTVKNYKAYQRARDQIQKDIAACPP